GFIGFGFYRPAYHDPRIKCFVGKITAHTGAITVTGHDFNAYREPALIILGTSDNTVSPNSSRATYNALQGPKGKVEIVGMGHGSGLSDPAYTNIYKDAVTAFLRRWLYGLDTLGTIQDEVNAT